MTATDETEMFHGKFIPNDPTTFRSGVRLLIGFGLAALIFIILMLSVNVLQSWGEWVTASCWQASKNCALLSWVQDAVRHPPTSLDEDPEMKTKQLNNGIVDAAIVDGRRSFQLATGGKRCRVLGLVSVSERSARGSALTFIRPKVRRLKNGSWWASWGCYAR